MQPQNDSSKNKEVAIARLTALQTVIVALISAAAGVITTIVSTRGVPSIPDGDASTQVDEKQLKERIKSLEVEKQTLEARVKEFEELPVLILMDSHIPDAVYSGATQSVFGSNTDDINEIIDSMFQPSSIRREATNPGWNREDSIWQQQPDLIIIHKSAFYDYESSLVEAENQLMNFLERVAEKSPGTSFLIYSRGFCDQRNDFMERFERNYRLLKQRTEYLGVCTTQLWQDNALKRQLKEKVENLLEIQQSVSKGPLSSNEYCSQMLS